MNNPVYNRYFRAVGGDLGRRMLAQLTRQAVYLQGLEALARSLGASQVRTWQHDGALAGFVFEDQAALDRLEIGAWLKNSVGLIPKRKENRKFWDLVRSLGTPSTAQHVLRDFGLCDKKWMTARGVHYPCRIVGFYEADVWFIEVPSRHFDAGTLEAAKLAKASGQSGTNAINMLWTPPGDWAEVTLGQYLAEWDELRQQELNNAKPSE